LDIGYHIGYTFKKSTRLALWHKKWSFGHFFDFSTFVQIHKNGFLDILSSFRAINHFLLIAPLTRFRLSEQPLFNGKGRQPRQRFWGFRHRHERKSRQFRRKLTGFICL